jgi:hypothetical protein
MDGKGYNFMNTVENSESYGNLMAHMHLGLHETVINGKNVLSSTVGITDTYLIGEHIAITNKESDIFRFIIFVDTDEAQVPSIMI